MVGIFKVLVMTCKGNVLTLCFSMYCLGHKKKKEIREHVTTYNMCFLRIDLNCRVIEIEMSHILFWVKYCPKDLSACN